MIKAIPQIIYVYFYGLFNDPTQSTVYTAECYDDQRIMNWIQNEIAWLNFRYHSGIYNKRLKIMRKEHHSKLIFFF
jgi:hypothetical protein